MSMIGCYMSLTREDVQKLVEDENYVEDLLEDGGGDRQTLEIEKSWQGIHFVLNGDPWDGSGPLHNAVLGGKEIGEDLGYGPARLLTPDEVTETARALEAISVQEFQKRTESSDFSSADIYVYSAEDPSEISSELTEYFTEVRSFFNDAAKRHDGMLLYLS